MQTAFKTWDHAEESLESIEMRIHDGVPRDHLTGRAQGYVNLLYSMFPDAIPKPDYSVLEVGSGVGYIMEAVMQRFHPARIIGLDVAQAMIDHAEERLARDHVDCSTLSFQFYDGTNFPFPDASIDHIYSVAALQHVPKPYVYNLFGEMLRTLNRGVATIHLLSFEQLKTLPFPFQEEVRRQIEEVEGHWHHFYSRDELFHVLSDGYHARDVNIHEMDGSIWLSFKR